MGIAGHCNVYGVVPDRAIYGATCHPRPPRLKRCQHVDGLGYSAGRSRHRAPRVARWEERFDRGPLRVGHTDATSGQEDDFRLWIVPKSRSKYKRTLSRSGGYETVLVSNVGQRGSNDGCSKHGSRRDVAGDRMSILPLRLSSLGVKRTRSGRCLTGVGVDACRWNSGQRAAHFGAEPAPVRGHRGPEADRKRLSVRLRLGRHSTADVGRPRRSRSRAPGSLPRPHYYSWRVREKGTTNERRHRAAE